MAVTTRTQHELSMRNPAFAELLPVRDFLTKRWSLTSGASWLAMNWGIHCSIPQR
jgi:hypothetical protein